METGPNLPSSSPILTLVLMIVMAAMLITSTKWFLVEVPSENKELGAEAQKLVGSWEQPIQDRIIYMDLDEDGAFRYALRESDRLNISGTWKLDEGRLVLHIDKVNAGSTFMVGDNVTLGPVLNVESRTLILGTEQDKVIFRRRR
ncbi:MAG TPA: hypothetical protein VGP99_04060 [Tepidisphaeraceae bacterium]|jgi:hypothetical protein|nr:hypothetical protein [Tepidisphaeraceae bacterium]